MVLQRLRRQRFGARLCPYRRFEALSFLGSGGLGDVFHVKRANHQTVLFHVKHTVGSLSPSGVLSRVCATGLCVTLMPYLITVSDLWL